MVTNSLRLWMHKHTHTSQTKAISWLVLIKLNKPWPVNVHAMCVQCRAPIALS